MTKAWEREKQKMHELYMVRNLKLSQMKEIMLKQHNFQASERAYKQKFKEWRWFKKTPRNSGVNSGGITIGVVRTAPPGLAYKFPPPPENDPIRRNSNSSSLDMGHQGQMSSSPTSYPDTSVSSDHPGYPDPLIPYASVHNPQSIVRASDGYSQLSLPPVAELRLLPYDTLKDSVRSAALHLEEGDLDSAEGFLEHATKTIQWLKRCG